MKLCRNRGIALIVYALAFTLAGSEATHAQDFPIANQIEAAVATEYNHLGLIEYCADKGYASADDVAAARLEVRTALRGFTVMDSARAHEAQGRRGEILGRQFIGLMRQDSTNHPEIVAEGQTMSLADNARAQNLTERALCGQMAAQEQEQTKRLRTH